MSEARSQRPVWLGEDRRRWDHIRIHTQLLSDGRIDAYDIAVYAGIAAHAELASGRAFPAATTLARYACISERKVRTCVAKLRALVYIEVIERPGHASVYVLLPPPPLHDMQGSKSNTPAPRADHPGRTFRGTPARGADEQESLNENQEQDPPNPPQAGGGTDAQTSAQRARRTASIDAAMNDEPFLAFWAAYPNRKDKRRAAQAWLAACRRGADPAKMAASAAAYATEVADRDATLIKLPATWLNAGSYDNEPDATPTSRSKPKRGTGPARSTEVTL